MSPSLPFIHACNSLREALQHIPDPIISLAGQQNSWFDPENIAHAAQSWVNVLTEDHVTRWLEPYSQASDKISVAIIMAGNIPFVGLHDLLCTLAAGHTPLCKLSSSDRILMKYCIEVLNREPGIAITMVDKVKDADAVIATGSNNTAKIFASYFSKLPNIIRKNRTAVGVLTGHETNEELHGLGADIFTYYGLGCRNISKIFVPVDYDFTHFFEAVFPYGKVGNHNKYANNYDYNKAIYLMGLEKFLDNNFMILRQDTTSIHSPLAVLFYEHYNSLDELKARLSELEPEIQCVSGKINLNFPRQVGLGETQNPKLGDYADGIDTMAFLLNPGRKLPGAGK
jgi:hypothetical protein